MKIHNLLDDILGSKSKIRILRLMFKYPNREFTEREIAQMVKMSPNTINLALKELRRSNIFKFKRLGKTHAYKCNQKSILYKIIKNLFEKETSIKVSLLNLLENKLASVEKCIIFGSYAKEHEEFDSDLDLLIIAKDKIKAEVMVEEVSEELLQRFSIVTSPIILTPKEFKSKRKKPFIQEALALGLPIVGKRSAI